MFESINPFHKFSYKATVDAQIKLYKKFKINFSLEEDGVLNELINSRIRTELMLPEFSQTDPKKYYAEILRDKNKTFLDVILSIVYFEFIETRRNSLKGLEALDKLNFMAKVKDYTEKRIVNDLSSF